MAPKDQLQSGNDYTPSERARRGMSMATGKSAGAPDHADTGSSSAPAEADQPSDQHTGGKVMTNTQTNESSATEPTGSRGKKEQGDM